MSGEGLKKILRIIFCIGNLSEQICSVIKLLTMWNIISSNRLVDRKIRKDNYRRHKLSLKNTKAQIDQSSPLQFQFLKSKMKPRMIAHERSVKIESENMALLIKMMAPQDQGQFILRNNRLKDGNYSQTHRKLQKQLSKKNKTRMLRLLQIPSCIDFCQMERKNYQNDKIKANINRTQYLVMSYGKRRPSSAM